MNHLFPFSPTLVLYREVAELYMDSDVTLGQMLNVPPIAVHPYV